MYHIKPDRRSQRSAHLICRGFNRCIAHQNFNQLTISQIVQASQVGRATFYRLFDAKKDILLYQCDQICKQAVKDSSVQQSTRDFFLIFTKLCLKNNLLFQTIIESHQANLIYETLMKRLTNVKKHFKIANNLPPEQLDYFLSDLTYLIIGTLKTWIKHNKRESAQELLTDAAHTIGIIYRSIR